MAAALVTPDQLAMYLALPTIDTNRAELLLELAQEKCESVVSPLPPEAKGVVLDVAARAYTNPQMVQQQAIGSVQVSYGRQTGGLWLTKANMADLLRLTGRTRAFMIDLMPPGAGSAVVIESYPFLDTDPDGVPYTQEGYGSTTLMGFDADGQPYYVGWGNS